MKSIFLIAVFLLSGCGLQSQVDELKARADRDEAEIANLKNRVVLLEAQNSATIIQLNSISNQITVLQAVLADAVTQAEIDSLQTQINNLINNPINGVLALRNLIQNNTVAIAILQGYQNIVSIKDPCGPQGSYNEVFLLLSTGRYLASFSDNASGQNTRFAVLTDGNFVTTDGTHCYFTVSNSGTVISNEHN